MLSGFGECRDGRRKLLGLLLFVKASLKASPQSFALFLGPKTEAIGWFQDFLQNRPGNAPPDGYLQEFLFGGEKRRAGTKKAP